MPDAKNFPPQPLQADSVASEPAHVHDPGLALERHQHVLGPAQAWHSGDASFLRCPAGHGPVGSWVGLADGLALGDALGEALGNSTGLPLGDTEGLADGDAVGLTLGEPLGLPLGDCDGEELGPVSVGLVLGTEDGLSVGVQPVMELQSNTTE